jgi:hypothetical protein
VLFFSLYPEVFLPVYFVFAFVFVLETAFLITQSHLIFDTKIPRWSCRTGVDGRFSVPEPEQSMFDAFSDKEMFDEPRAPPKATALYVGVLSELTALYVGVLSELTRQFDLVTSCSKFASHEKKALVSADLDAGYYLTPCDGCSLALLKCLAAGRIVEMVDVPLVPHVRITGVNAMSRTIVEPAPIHGSKPISAAMAARLGFPSVAAWKCQLYFHQGQQRLQKQQRSQNKQNAAARKHKQNKHTHNIAARKFMK